MNFKRELVFSSNNRIGINMKFIKQRLLIIKTLPILRTPLKEAGWHWATTASRISVPFVSVWEAHWHLFSPVQSTPKLHSPAKAHTAHDCTSGCSTLSSPLNECGFDCTIISLSLLLCGSLATFSQIHGEMNIGYGLHSQLDQKKLSRELDSLFFFLPRLFIVREAEEIITIIYILSI